MQLFEAYPGMYRYKILPGFAQFILERHLDDFIKEQFRLSRQFNLPLLENITSRFTEEQLVEFSKRTSAEFLDFLSKDKAYEQIQSSMAKWLDDQLEVIGKFQIVAQDITVINFIREQSFKKLIPLYTSDLTQALDLSSEIDALMLGNTTTATDLYVNILKSKIEEESNFSDKLIQASPAITFLFDLVRNKEIFVSGKIQQVLGYSHEEMKIMGDDILLQLTHPEDLQKVASALEVMVEENSNSMHTVEYRFLHKDGNYRWMRTYFVVFRRDEQDLPVELLGKTFEVTQEIETGLALQKREQQLLEAQAIAHIGSYEWNIKDGYSVNTQQVYKIFELQQGENYDQFMHGVHPDDLQKVKHALEEAYKTGNYDCEYRYVKNGKEKVIWSLGRVEFKNEKPYRMVGTVQDITEIKTIEKELRKKTTQLEQSNKSLQQFASVASHDLKEPLRKISMFADMVMEAEKDNLSKSSMEKLARMQASSKSMMRMIQDILSFSMLEERQQKEFINLQDIVEDVVDLLDESIKEKNAEIHFDDLPEAFVIPSQMRQVFQNLISNALKFSKKDVPPKVNIATQWVNQPVEGMKTASKYLRISFCDNGIGIEEEYLQMIFDLFKRLHPKVEYEGSGLGLSIAKRIVDNHEGNISASSTPGKGTCFQITLPQ